MSDKRPLEILLETLSTQVQDAERQKKQLESRLKFLQGEVEAAEAASAKKLAEVADTTAAKIAALEAEAVPYREVVSRLKSQQAEAQASHQAMQNETMRLQAVRHQTLVALDAKIARATERLAKLTAEEQAFRKRIAVV